MLSEQRTVVLNALSNPTMTGWVASGNFCGNPSKQDNTALCDHDHNCQKGKGFPKSHLLSAL